MRGQNILFQSEIRKIIPQFIIKYALLSNSKSNAVCLCVLVLQCIFLYSCVLGVTISNLLRKKGHEVPEHCPFTLLYY